jgi:hypothetical protein
MPDFEEGKVIDMDAHIAAQKAALEAKGTPPPSDTPPADTPPPSDAPPADAPPVDNPPVDAPPVDAPPADAPPTEVDEFTAPEEISITVDGEEQTLKEVLTKYSDVQSELKKIKADPFLQKFIEFRLAGGEPEAFLNSQAKDWTKPTDFQILKEAFFASDKVAGLDDEAAEELFSRELSEKGYNVSSEGKFEDENSKEARVGKQLLARDASKLRQAHIEAQKKFSYEKPQEKPVVQFDPVKYRQELGAIEPVKNFLANKQVGISGTEYAHEVGDPEAVIGMITDTRKFWKLFQNPDKTTDYTKLQKALAFAIDPEGYDKDLLDLGYTLGEERFLKEKKNISNIRELDQNKDVDNKGFSKEGFLKAAKEQKVSFS